MTSFSARPARRSSAIARHVAGTARIRLIALAVTIAFAFQSYIAQTHIHGAAKPSVGIAKFLAGGQVAADKSGSQNRDNDPLPSDPDKCPLCQGIAHSGAYISPASAAALLPSDIGSVMAVVQVAAIVTRTTSFIWQGRAPPLR
jgi:hypothetical protein